MDWYEVGAKFSGQRCPPSRRSRLLAAVTQEQGDAGALRELQLNLELLTGADFRPVVKFRNKQDLLVYLVPLSDTDDGWRLTTGQQFGEHLQQEGKLDRQDPNREYAELGRMLWSLKEDSSITFEDTAMGGGPYAPARQTFRGFTMDDVWKFGVIEVTGHGRLVAQAARPTIAINIESIDLVLLFNMIEEEIDQLPIDDAVKEDARSRLGMAREALTAVGKTATTEAMSAALRHVLGLP